MWRWVTRGLVLSLAALLSTAAFAQSTDFVGALELPDPGVPQSGVILVKGFALDLQQIYKIELYVDDVFQHNVNTGIPRIDVVEAYPNWPGIHNAAPGFQTGFLASRFSNGPHTVSVKVFTSDKRVVEVGRRSINIDNTINQSPFGSVDIPDLSGIYNASGSFPVSGWATDTDGILRVDVLIDDLNMQAAMYGDPRPDVGNTYPDFPAALFSAFIANVDTTRVPDGVHLLTVRATDRLGMARVIGRRQIQIFNNEANLKPFGYLDEPKRDAVLYGTLCGAPPPVVSPPTNPSAHITPVRGWALDLATRTDVGRVSYVELLIDGVRWASTDDCNFSSIFGAYTNCYGLPRYDVERYYPNYPDAPRAGFMFTLDVGARISLGVRPGNHVMKVRVGDQQQTFAELPNRDGIPVFFTCADQNFDFAALGFIDFPTTYDYVKGNVTFQGWAIDENAGVAVVEIIIDGNFVGQAQYGYPRPDVQEANPQIFAARNSGWKFTMDTTKLSNARHRLTVRVRDQQSHVSEIGSVDFYTQNPPTP
jgi:N-acetylmuramoyl-L-alanine amidase